MRLAVNVNAEEGSVGWVNWADWLETQAGRGQDWTVVAEANDPSCTRGKDHSEMRACCAYLCADNKEHVSKALSKDTWDIRLGQLSIEVDGDREGTTVTCSVVKNGFEVFVTLLPEIGNFAKFWRLASPFTDYFELREGRTGTLVDPYCGDEVVRFPDVADSGPILIRTDYLQEYLAARNMYLIRQHDNRRFWKPLISGLRSDGDTKLTTTKWGCYRINWRQSDMDASLRFSRLVAKDFVPPAEEPGRVGRWTSLSETPQDLPTFSVRRLADGTVTKAKPNADALKPIVCFDPRVLKKYYDQPSLYSVGFSSPGLGGVGLDAGWSMSIGRNSEGLIQAWLGDLVKQGLPKQEISHWHAHSVPFRGETSADFWNSQMECKVPDTPSIETRFLSCRYHLRQEVQAAHGLDLFTDYKGPDIHLEKCLRQPLYDDHTEFRECIDILAKVFIEYLNGNGLADQLAVDERSDDQGHTLPTITLFRKWLEKAPEVSDECRRLVVSSFQMLQSVGARGGVAHWFSDSQYGKIIGQLGLSRNPSTPAVFDAIARQVSEALELWCDNLGISDRLWWMAPSTSGSQGS